ncbi:MAG: hypothetical protein ACYS76_02740 [Planctomycetota bacterium]|jgi:hypothetical protein
MSSIDTEEDVLSEDTEARGDGDSLKLVPVAESIRYRKRAQSAEKKVEALSRELAEVNAKASEVAEQLSNLQVEQELTRKLATVGTSDLETALLLAKAKLGAGGQADLDGVVEQLKKEKQYLFAGQQPVATTAAKTAGAKDRMQNSQTILERAAKRAAGTGSRRDLQDYLRLRRSFV